MSSADSRGELAGFSAPWVCENHSFLFQHLCGVHIARSIPDAVSWHGRCWESGGSFSSKQPIRSCVRRCAWPHPDVHGLRLSHLRHDGANEEARVHLQRRTTQDALTPCGLQQFRLFQYDQWQRFYSSAHIQADITDTTPWATPLPTHCV